MLNLNERIQNVDYFLCAHLVKHKRTLPGISKRLHIECMNLCTDGCIFVIYTSMLICFDVCAIRHTNCMCRQHAVNAVVTGNLLLVCDYSQNTDNIIIVNIGK